MVQPQQTHRPPLRSVLEAHVTVTAATYTAKAGDRVIGVNHTGAVTVTFPTAQLRSGRTYTVKDESGAAAANNITVATEGPEAIDGSATDTIIENYGSKTYYSDGSNWFTVPLLAVVSHTLASHSTKAHADLTGVGAADHHAQLHATAHEPAGGDAMAVDALAGTGSLRTLGAGAQQAATGNHIHAGGNDISARVHDSQNVSISDNTLTTVTFNSEQYDTDTIHDTSTNTSRLTAKTAGKYIIATSARWAANTNGIRSIEIKLNGTTVLAQDTVDAVANSSGITRVGVATQINLALNDYVEIRVFQDSGASLNLIGGLNNTWFAMVKVLG